MPDESLPTYTFQASSENPLHTILYYTHNGSAPSADYLIKRPAPAEARNQYALGFFDVQYASVLYAEVLLKPNWAQPTLSAAEMRAQNGAAAPVPLTPDAFAVSLYNPDQSVAVRRNQGSWKTDSWDFEIPVRTFKQPSSSRIDRDASEPTVPELVPKMVFRWKRDGRLNKDMTCYLTGREVGGNKSKEPDITVALFHNGKHETSVTIYEPNMARVGVEDMKGLEVVLLLSAEVIRDLYLSPQPDPFNTGATATASSSRPRKNSRPSKSPPGGATMSGALNARPKTPAAEPPAERQPRPAQRQQEIDAETKRLKKMVEEEERQERERRDKEEQQRIKRMLEEEERQRQKREADIEAETERLRREYGVQAPSSPPLPPRRDGNGGRFSPPTGPPPQQPPRPTRPQSAGPSQMQWQRPPPQQPTQQSTQQQSQQNGGRRRNPLTALFRGTGENGQPYAGPAGASVSGFFQRINNNDDDRRREDGRNKVQKKRSVHF
ncbi:hypothetical protein B0I35DRAFT_483343 [Stachybotrys elegans]|uniref:Uncharacterized protein n=1 Tax=Stachybotrys elegans TaxID=80388 RepID=A0A8K0SH63_9HYPO|nr:hypothetical protein B0I35DRAFT_483343 [Stachybotrys elegans]